MPEGIAMRRMRLLPLLRSATKIALPSGRAPQPHKPAKSEEAPVASRYPAVTDPASKRLVPLVPPCAYVILVADEMIAYEPFLTKQKPKVDASTVPVMTEPAAVTDRSFNLVSSVKTAAPTPPPSD